jgi:hypothetical protein
VVCETQCTGTFNACSDRAKGNSAAQGACNGAYGTCRDDCRKVLGGGGSSPGTSGALTPTNLSPSSDTVACNKSCVGDYRTCAALIASGKTTATTCYAGYLACHSKC